MLRTLKMASTNAKPKNSFDAQGETEWTFIDTDEGVIETRKDSVTYRKATYSEILKGVVAEDLEKVESEPEFEVLASFKFRQKGESFGLKSSPPVTDPELQEKESKLEVDNGGESPIHDDSSSGDDDIMIISSYFDEQSRSKVQLQASNNNECNSNVETNIQVEETAAGSLSDEKDGEDSEDSDGIEELYDDDDFMITHDPNSAFEEPSDVDNADGSDGNGEEHDNNHKEKDGDIDVESFEEPAKSTNKTEEYINDSFFQNDKNEQTLNEESHDHEESNAGALENDDGDEFLSIFKGGIYDISANKDLDWNTLTFQLLSTFPRMTDSAITLGDDYDSKQDDTDNIKDPNSENMSDSSQDDNSSFEEVSDPVGNESKSYPMIPRWFFEAEGNAEARVKISDDDTDHSISDMEELDFVAKEPGLVPLWLFNSNSKTEDMDGSCNDDFDFISSDIGNFSMEEASPIIPSWFFDPINRKEHPKKFCDDYPDYRDNVYDYDSDVSDFDDSSSVALPKWLFDENYKRMDKDDEGFFWTSHLFVDVPTFIILLFLTTALGFSIGHGLTVYFSGQGANRQGNSNAKLQSFETPSKQFAGSLEELGLNPEEIAKIELLKLENELYRQKESEMLSQHLRFDLRELYKRLQKKHYRLLRNHKSTEDQLHISKSMSWYWRSKFDEEKRQNRKTDFHKNLRPKNFEEKLPIKWRRYKKNHTAPLLGKRVKLSQRLIVNPVDEKQRLKGQIINKRKAEFTNLYWLNAIPFSKSNDMENFKRRWTQDFKDTKRKCSDSNKTCALKKEISSIAPNPFVWVKNGWYGCRKRANKKSFKKTIEPPNENPADKILRNKSQGIELQPCFVKPKKCIKVGASFKNRSLVALKNKSRHAASKARRTMKPKGEYARRSSHQHRRTRGGQIKKGELNKAKLEIMNQINELKRVLFEVRRERRRAEKEKAKLEVSWRKLKRQRLEFEKERTSQKKFHNMEVKRVKFKLSREKNRIKTWRNIARKARKKAKALHKDLKRVSLAKQKLKNIKSIKKELKLEKRKLRKQMKKLKSMKQQLRKEHGNYARERWKIKKKRREVEGTEGFNQSEATTKDKETNKEKKRNRYKTKRRRERHSTRGFRDKNSKHGKQKRFWKTLEEHLYKWAKKVNKTIEHHRRGKAGEVWKTIRYQFGKLMDWTTRKSPKPSPKKKKKQRRYKRKQKARSSIFEKVLAKQIKFDEEKRNARKMIPEDDWKSRGPIINKKRKIPNEVKEKKMESKQDPGYLLRQRKRKDKRKYRRELELFQQWALQMNEKRLEHDMIYREERRNMKGFKAHGRKRKCYSEKEEEKPVDAHSKSGALMSLNDSNGTFMLLLQPRSSVADDKSLKKEDDIESEDGESVNLGPVIKSQLDHELSKKKKTDTSLTLPLDDDVIKLPNDVNKAKPYRTPIGVSSFEGEGLSNSEPTPPLFSPTFYEEFPTIKIIEDASPKKIVPVDVDQMLPPEGSKNQKEDGNDQWIQPWYMRRAKERDISRNSDPTFKIFPRPFGPLKSDGTWFFHRSSDRALQRETHEPLNRQSTKDGIQHNSWRSYFHRDKRWKEIKDGKWVFDRANDRAEQRSALKEPWYMRRAEGRQRDRDKSKVESSFIERGYYQNYLHGYDEEDDEDYLMNDYDDYDDFEENEYSWNPTVY